MPFDHASCPGCQAILDPERLVGGQGNPKCPRCHTELSFVDIFGVADAFREDEAENLSLDDLVPGSKPKPTVSAAKELLSLDALIPGRRR